MEDIPMTDMSDGSFLIPETQMELDVRSLSYNFALSCLLDVLHFRT